TNGLHQRLPLLSVQAGLAGWQHATLIAAPLGLALALAIAPMHTLAMLLGLTSMVFALVILVRFTALTALIGRAVPKRVPPVRSADLPTYAVLVPLFQEGAIVRDTIAALARLDYPADRLTIVLVCEGNDVATLDAATLVPLPPHFALSIVPPAQPQTKPKALNYALIGVDADYVVVYDAEDLPDPLQLRHAAARFAAAPATLGCLQARLNVYNQRDSWLTQQFTIEYTALFDGLLPALERLRLPIPLGGTSNHFRRDVLDAVGGWDAFNVTEDADLGIRLNRLGYNISIMPLTTMEEAPATLGVWMKQRTRWLLGWMQTLAVHTRVPHALLADLGVWRTFGLLSLAFGSIATVLLHPVLYIALALEAFEAHPFGSDGRLGPALIWALAGTNFILGFGSAIGLAAAGLAGRGWWHLMPGLLTMPFYWLLTSLAGWRAVWQLMIRGRQPLRWEKTPHRPRRSSETAL
ncbi:MAG: glycosyltransferase, partial [Pseudomonadota bacterium]